MINFIKLIVAILAGICGTFTLLLWYNAFIYHLQGSSKEVYVWTQLSLIPFGAFILLFIIWGLIHTATRTGRNIRNQWDV